MKKHFSTLLLFATLLHASPLLAADANNCDRNCLSALLKQYMNAVVSHDPAAAPLMVGFRQTDNAIVVRPGTGVWQAVTSLGKVQREYLDPVTGQAAYFGTVNEGDKPVVVTARIKVLNRQIAEAEWFIARDTDPGAHGPSEANLYGPDNLTANPPPVRNVPKKQRLSRDSLIGITETYFDGITGHDGSLVLARDGCFRLENGVTVTGRPLAAGSTDGFEGRTDCASGFAASSAGSGLGISVVANRRYVIVDEQQQVVLALGIFMRSANSEMRRNNFSEYFYITDNVIDQIYSAMHYPSPHLPVPNWLPHDGNFPLPASFGEAK
jgi:hypothetical protein